MNESQSLMSKTLQVRCSNVCVSGWGRDRHMVFNCEGVTGLILGQMPGMVVEQRERGQLLTRGAGQRSLQGKVIPELSLKHDLGRISKSRNGAGDHADKGNRCSAEGGLLPVTRLYKGQGQQ